MKKSFENAILTVVPEGRITTANASEFQSYVISALDEVSENESFELVIDCGEMESISSSGLRVMVTIREKKPDFKVVNVSPEVYEVFEMTGFTRIMNIERGFRKYSVEGLEEIGRGTCGTVYRIDEEKVIKVFKEGFNLERIKNEQNCAREAFINGIDTAISYEVVQVEDRFGAIYEVLNAKTVRQCMLEDPENADRYFEAYASFLKLMHSKHMAGGTLPSVKEKWLSGIDYLGNVLNEEEISKTKKLFEALPDTDTFVHGDCNIGNVMFMDGKVMLIDMGDAGYGNPMFDLLGVYLGYVLIPEMMSEEMIKAVTGFGISENKAFWKKFTEIYFGVTDESELEEIGTKIRPYAAFRVVQASLAVDIFPKEMVEECKEMMFASTDRND